MRYRLMATYRGAPYEAGIGPADGAVVLFAACPPPEELGFEPATGHWRKELSIDDVQAVWQSRPVGKFRGDSCIVLDDLGDRLHIGYLGHDAYRAEQLGYWQVDRGVFELVAARDEVTDIVEERTDYQPAPVSYPDAPDSYAPDSYAPDSYALASYRDAPPSYRDVPPSYRDAPPSYPGSPASYREAPPASPGGPASYPGAEAPLPLEAAAMRAASAASRREQPVSPSGPGPAAEPFPPAGSAMPADPSGTTGPGSAPSGFAGLYAAPVTATAFPGPAPSAPLAEAAAAAGDSPRRRRSAGGRMATEQLFGELASLAAIPATAYSVGEEVDGAMCLLPIPDGFEVFSSAGGARHEVRVFSDEESACFYLFGVLAADAVRTGGLVPVTGRPRTAPPAPAGAAVAPGAPRR